jgi:hypothetical protein
MKVTSIGLYSSKDIEVAILSFRDPKSLNPYVVKNIIGLDADEIVPRFYAQSMNHDGMYFDLSIPSREIVISMMLNPEYGEYDKTYSDLRDDVYKAISSSRTGALRLKFYDGFEEKAQISGFVTKLEYPHFTDLPEIQLTLRCDDPMLRGPVQTSLRGRSNADTSILDVLDSTAPHGFEFKLTFTGNSTGFRMHDKELDWEFLVEPTNGFLTGDVLIFSSQSGDKELKMIRANVDTHLVDKISRSSVWPILFPGTNKFIHTPSVQWNYIKYYPTYWGV